MNLSEVKAVFIPRKRSIRVGRGTGSGKGKTCGKGMKGQNSRSGVTVPVVFEGGTMPLYRRIPKRGFNNKRFSDTWYSVNISDLNCFQDGDVINLKKLIDKGVLNVAKSRRDIRLKVLGQGELKVQKLKIRAHRISKTALEQLTEKDGNVEIVKIRKYRKPARRRNS